MKSRMLVREFIYDRLYHPKEGYFTNNPQLGSLKQPIIFKDLLGYEDYVKALQTNYPENRWLTPSEVFRPYYGVTIGNYIHQQFAFINKPKLRIVEVGAGYGAACEGAMHYFRNYAPELYASLEYHLVEISPAACQAATQRLQREFAGPLRKGNLRVVNSDFLQYKPLTHKNEVWFILFLEVFDNLPHDKVVDGKQVEVEDMRELLAEMTDPVIRETYAHYKDFQQLKRGREQSEITESLSTRLVRRAINLYYGKEKTDSIFLPTVSLQVLKYIKQNFLYPSLIVADFDQLKNQFTQEAVNSPIVSKKLRLPHEKEDFESYLVERGQADIFFPTDFNFLRYIVKKELGFDSRIFKAHQFAQDFAKSSWTTTQSGYNPLKEDFGNTSFLVTDHS